MVSNIFSTCSFLIKSESLYGLLFCLGHYGCKITYFLVLLVGFDENRFVISKRVILFYFIYICSSYITFVMKIIIAGSGEVGFHLAKLLSFESQDITLIDTNRESLAYAVLI